MNRKIKVQKPPIRVLQVLSTLKRGGAETMVMNYYRKIDRSKVQFDFLLHRTELGDFEGEIEAMGGQIFRLRRINPVYPYPYYTELKKFLQNRPYPVLHIHLNTFSSFPQKIAQKLGIPCIIIHAHTALEKINIKKAISNPKYFFAYGKHIIKYQLRKKLKFSKAHHFACSQIAGDWLFGSTNSYTIIPNAVKTKNFQFDIDRSMLIKKKQNLENILVLGHIGRFVYPKNHLYLLNIFKEIIALHPDSVLILVGDGVLRGEIQIQAQKLNLQDCIQFLGDRNDVPDLLQLMDIMVFPSLFEGLPVTLIEAQAAGLKIFAADTISMEVKITDNLTFLPLKISPKVWAQEILKQKNYSRTNTKSDIINKGYDIDKNAKDLENFYLKNSIAIDKSIESNN